MNDAIQTKQKIPNQKSDLSVNGNLNKETEPVKASKEGIYFREVKEEEISPEIKEIGVVQRPERIDVPPDLKQIGISPTGFATPVPFKPTLKLPIDDTKIEEGLHMNILNSLRWLAEWCLFQLKRAHLTLKVIKGVVRRVRI